MLATLALLVGCSSSEGLVPDSASEPDLVPVGTPNLLVLLLDDVGVDKVGVYARDLAAWGYVPEHLPATPVMDGLAEHGVRFSDAWSTPQCSSTRAGLMTGIQPYRTGIGSPIPPAPELSEGATTVAEKLAGTHRSGTFGKWHLGTTGDPEDPVPFLDLLGMAAAGSAEEPSTAEHTVNPLRHGWERFSGGLGGDICTSDGQGGCVGDYMNWVAVAGDLAWTAEGSAQPVASVWQENRFATEQDVATTLAWIDTLPPTDPWLALVSFRAPHVPHEDQTPQGCTTSDFDPETLDEEAVMFQTMLECADTHIGALLEGLATRQALEGTLIVLMGDNGTSTVAGEGTFATERRGKGTTYQSGIQVPLVVTDGGTWLQGQGRDATHTTGLVAEPGRVIETPVLSLDLHATLVSAAGGSPDDNLDSWDLLGMIGDPQAPAPDRVVYTETFREDQAGRNGFAAVRDAGGQKLFLNVQKRDNDDGPCLSRELYDLTQDPFETRDRAADSDAAEDLDALTALLSLVQEAGGDWTAVEDCPLE